MISADTLEQQEKDQQIIDALKESDEDEFSELKKARPNC
jgi:hypothetical protein